MTLALVAVLALENPVIASIVAERYVEIPGVGRVENTNQLLDDPATVGLKTGSLGDINTLLSARDVLGSDGETIRVFIVVMGQTTTGRRFDASRALYDQIGSSL
ncbi:hypothetical protein [Microbacterium aurugineum]